MLCFLFYIALSGLSETFSKLCSRKLKPQSPQSENHKGSKSKFNENQ